MTAEGRPRGGVEAGHRREDTGARRRGDGMVAEEGSRHAARWLPSPPASMREDRYAVARSTYSLLPCTHPPSLALGQSESESEVD